jgi:RimJ/RimL family protein N-acetyltransferase
MQIEDISIADFSHADIPGMLEYWYRSPRAHLVAMGVSPESLPREKHMCEMLEMNIEKNRAAEVSRQAILSIKLRGETIGVHELTHIDPPVSAIMHAHIWSGSHRGLGIGLVSYVLAMKKFFSRFDLKEIRFETPLTNAGAQRIKTKLGIQPREETGSITLPIVDGILQTMSYRVLRSELPDIEDNMHKEWARRSLRHEDAFAR